MIARKEKKKTAVAQLMKDIKFLLFHKCPQRNHLIFGRELLGKQCLKGWTQWGRRKHSGMNTASRSCEERFHPEENVLQIIWDAVFFFGQPWANTQGVTLRKCLALINADNRGRFISFAKVKTFLASSSNFIKYKHFSHSAFPPLEQNPSLATGQLLIANAS